MSAYLFARRSSLLVGVLAALTGLQAPLRSAPQAPVEIWGASQFSGIEAPYGSQYVALGRGAIAAAIRADGSIKTWGNNFGASPPGTGYIDVASSFGEIFNEPQLLTLDAAGAVDVWGAATLNLGPGPAGTGFVEVDGGGDHALALHSDGTVTAWGLPCDGEIDDVPSDADYIGVAATSGSSHLLRTDGSIVSVGFASNDVHGLIGDTPSGTGFTSIVAGRSHMLALRSDGSIAAWGNDSDGQVSDTPTGTGFVQLAAGTKISYALHQDGWIAAWGIESNGDVSQTPSGSRFAAVGAASYFGYALRAEAVGTPTCLGNGSEFVNCPCMNHSNPGREEGCLNSTGVGAVLTSTGSASYAADDLRFHVLQARAAQTAVLVEGATSIQIAFRDGLLCTGSPTERIEFLALDGLGSASSTASIAAESTAPGPGATRNYQAWYRDPAVSVCGTGSNLTNAMHLTWN